MLFPEPVSFQEADDFLRSRQDTATHLKSREIAMMWDAEARQAAFFSARVTQAAIVSRLHDVCQSVLSGQMSRAQARRLLREYFLGEGADALAAMGFAPARRAMGISQLASLPRLELIIYQNVKMAQERGHYQQWQKVKQDFPYGIWRVGNCQNHREAHLARDGKIYAFDHPIWTQSPPGGEFNCHCYRELISAKDMKERGLSPEPIDSEFEPSSLGFDPSRPLATEPVFGRTTRPEYADISRRQCEEEKPSVQAELEQRQQEQAKRVEAAAQADAKAEAEAKAKAEEAARAKAEAEARAKEEAAAKAAAEARAKEEAEAKARAEEAAKQVAQAAEAARKAEEQARAAEEAARKAAEEAARQAEIARLEAERKAAEEAARLEAERLAAEEAARQERERLAAEEATKREPASKQSEERKEETAKAPKSSTPEKGATPDKEEAERIEQERIAAEDAVRKTTSEANAILDNIDNEIHILENRQEIIQYRINLRDILKTPRKPPFEPRINETKEEKELRVRNALKNAIESANSIFDIQGRYLRRVLVLPDSEKIKIEGQNLRWGKTIKTDTYVIDETSQGSFLHPLFDIYINDEDKYPIKTSLHEYMHAVIEAGFFREETLRKIAESVKFTRTYLNAFEKLKDTYGSFYRNEMIVRALAWFIMSYSKKQLIYLELLAFWQENITLKISNKYSEVWPGFNQPMFRDIYDAELEEIIFKELL